MPAAINPQTGEFLVLGQDGQWAPPTMAQNPQTGEKVYLDDGQWKPVPFKATLSKKDQDILASEGTLGGATRSLANGASGGLLDEVSAAGGATGAFLRALTDGQGVSGALDTGGKRYDEILNRERGASREFAKDNPAVNAALEILGGIGGVKGAGAPTATTLAAPTTGQTALQAAKAGGAIGAVSGFGSGEDGFTNRAENAAKIGTLSAILGGATPYVVQGASHAKEVIANLLGSGGEDKAQRLILRGLERDSIPLDEAAARYNAAQAAGYKPEALIDVGGENTRGLMRGAAGTPGPAKEMAVNFVESRQAGQPGRVASDIESAISPNTNYTATIDDIISSRANASRPLYEQAYAEAGPIHSERLQQFLDDPIVQKGLATGYKIQRLEALAEGRPFNPNEMAITGFNDAGDPILGATPNLRTLDAIKRGLDDTLEQYRDKTTGKLVLDQTGRAIDMVRRAFVNTVDSLAPESYRAARAAFAGHSKLLDAMATGRSLLNRDPEITAKQLASMTPSERDFVRAGLAKALRDKAASVQDGADITKRIFGNPAMRDRIAAAFETPEQFSAFENAVNRESQMYANAQRINPRAGSRTAPMLQEMQDVRQNPVVQFGGDVAESGLKGALVRGVGRLYDRGRGINPNTSRSLAEMLLATDPATVNANFASLGNRLASDKELAGRLSRYLRDIGALEGKTVGALSN
jgi:hypothetical protein